MICIKHNIPEENSWLGFCKDPQVIKWPSPNYEEEEEENRKKMVVAGEARVEEKKYSTKRVGVTVQFHWPWPLYSLICTFFFSSFLMFESMIQIHKTLVSSALSRGLNIFSKSLSKNCLFLLKQWEHVFQWLKNKQWQ